MHGNTVLEVYVNRSWIPFSVFENGKHKMEIEEFIEGASSQQDLEIAAMVLAEALGTSIRYVDECCGIYYKVQFSKGSQTKISTYTFRNVWVKTFAVGAEIPENWEGVLEHVLDI